MYKLFILDVDGTLTDGKINIGYNGEVFKSFNVKDGYGIKKLIANNIIPIIITGRKSEIVEFRCKELGITEIYQDVDDKRKLVEEIIIEKQLNNNEIIFMGDDENDLEAIKICGLTFAPNNAVEIVKQNVDYITVLDGGEGCVREAIEFVLNEKIN